MGLSKVEARPITIVGMVSDFRLSEVLDKILRTLTNGSPGFSDHTAGRSAVVLLKVTFAGLLDSLELFIPKTVARLKCLSQPLRRGGPRRQRGYEVL